MLNNMSKLIKGTFKTENELFLTHSITARCISYTDRITTMNQHRKIQDFKIQYLATSGILLPAPNAFDEILNTGGAWYLLYSLEFIIRMTL
jgi:hypothetical protein